MRSLARDLLRPGASWRDLPLFALLVASAAAVLPATAAPPPDHAALPMASVEGVATDPLGRTLPGVEIRLVAERGAGRPATLRITRTGEDGRFSVAGLAPGPYRLIAVKGGYAVLVGQIDTMLRRSLELVLHPAGDPGAPGSRPADASWALRLPVRDRLESLEASATSGGESAGGGSLPLVVEFTATQRAADSADSGAGVAGGIAGGFDLAGRGILGLAVRHRDEGLEGVLRDDADDLLLRYTPAGDLPFVPVALQAELRRQMRSRRVPGSARSAEASTAGARLSAAHRTGDGDLGVLAKVWVWEGRQEVPFGADRSQEGKAYRVTLGVAKTLETGSGRRTRFETSLRHTSGVVQRGPDGRARMVPALADLAGEGNIEDAAGTQLELHVDDTWSARGGKAEFHADLRARGDRSAGSGAGALAGVSFGARCELARAISMEIEGGWIAGMDARREPVYRVGVSGDAGRVSWSIVRGRQLGFTPWEGRRGESSWYRDVLPLVTGLTARIDSWVVEADVEPRGRVPGFHLRGARFDAAGDLAPRLVGDLPFVSVTAGAAGSGLLVDLAVDHARTGTLVEISWETVDDASAGGFLDGLREWTRRQVRLRQRIGDAFGERATWHLLLGMEESDVGGSGDAARLAMLVKRRLSGGLSVAF